MSKLLKSLVSEVKDLIGRPKKTLNSWCWQTLMMLSGVAITPSVQPTNGCDYTTGNVMEEKILTALKAIGGSAKPAELVTKLRGKAKDYMLTDWLFWDFYPALRELVNNGRVVETRDTHDAATLHLVEGKDA